MTRFATVARVLNLLCLALWLHAAPSFAQASAQPAAFGFDDVATIAQREAAAPYVAPVSRLPAELKALNYDGLRDIRYRPEKAIWREHGLPFELQFFHLGGGAQCCRCTVHEVHEGRGASGLRTGGLGLRPPGPGPGAVGRTSPAPQASASTPR